MPTVQKEMEPRAGCLSLRVLVTLGGAMVWCHYERRCQSQSLTWEAGIGLLYFLILKQICIICTVSFSTKKKKGENAPRNPTSWHCTEVPSLMISKTLWVVCARTPPALWNPHDFSHIPTQAAEQLGPLFYVWLCQCDFCAPCYLVVSSCPSITNDGVWEEVGRAQEGRVSASIPLPFSGLLFFPVGWHPLLCFLRYPLNVSLGLLETCSSAVAWQDCGNMRLACAKRMWGLLDRIPESRAPLQPRSSGPQVPCNFLWRGALDFLSIHSLASGRTDQKLKREGLEACWKGLASKNQKLGGKKLTRNLPSCPLPTKPCCLVLVTLSFHL